MCNYYNTFVFLFELSKSLYSFYHESNETLDVSCLSCVRKLETRYLEPSELIRYPDCLIQNLPLIKV